MQRYIGVKIVNAEPMTAGVGEDKGFIVKLGERSRDAEGYLVEYEGGYQLWCPKKQFDFANRLCDEMPFGHAIEAAKQGKSFKLPQWQDDVFISIQTPDEKSKMSAPYLYVTSRFGMVPWIPTMIELLSEKWQIVD